VTITSAEPIGGQPPFFPGLRIVVSVPEQRLTLVSEAGLAASYPVSTSKVGLGFEPGSLRTPTGAFTIAEMIGGGAAPGAVFRSRECTGEIAEQGGEEDLILTRILWLSGDEAANANTRERMIYIHGTNQEERIGSPASHGCIRMRGADIIDLFARVQPGTRVEIVG